MAEGRRSKVSRLIFWRCCWCSAWSWAGRRGSPPTRGPRPPEKTRGGNSAEAEVEEAAELEEEAGAGVTTTEGETVALVVVVMVPLGERLRMTVIWPRAGEGAMTAEAVRASTAAEASVRE
jgi:hypothetical protein